LRLGFGIVAVAGVGLAWACNTTNNGTPVGATTMGDSGGSSGGISSSSGSTSGGSSSSSSTSAPPNVTFGPIIDDMLNIQSDGPGTQGSWYTYSDRSIANSEPPIVPANEPGSINPAEGQSFPANNGDGGLTLFSLPSDISDPEAGTTGPFNYRECWGGGEKTWGAGFGLDLFDNTPDGGDRIAEAFNACPTEAGIFEDSPDAGAIGIPQPFDASAYTGFAFWGISLTGADYPVNIQVDDDQTSPWGGQCNVCQNGGTCSTPHEAGTTGMGCPCSDNFLETVEFTPSWKLFVIRWSDHDFVANNYSHEGTLTFHPNAMYNIHFQFKTTSGVTLKDFDVAVSLLQWVTN
jgi:hypothetical protein